MATIGELFVNLNADTSNFDRGMNNANKSANSFGGVMKSIAKNVASFMVYDVGKKLVTGFVDGAKAGINYNATLETSAIKWETLLGTQEKANKMLNDIEKFAATTPFEKMGVEAMATQLHNAGFEGQTLFDQLTKFGDMAGAFGIQADSLQEMVRQYSQVQQAGVAYTEDLNILQDRGVPIYKAIAEQLGINTADVKKWASEGKISADIYQEALDNLAKGVEGGMQKQSKSFDGMLSTFKDGMNQLLGIMSKPIFDYFAKQLEKAVVFQENLVEAVQMFMEEVGNGQSVLEAFLTAVSNVFGEHIMVKIEEFMPFIQGFINGIIGIFNSLKDNVKIILDAIMGFWNEHSNWLIPLITFVWGFVASFISNTINAIGAVVQSGLAIIDGIINFFQNLFKGNFEGAWESIKQIFSNAIIFIWNYMQVNFAVNIPNMIKNFKKNFAQWIDDAWIAVKKFFRNGADDVVNFAKQGFMNCLNAVREWMSQVPSTIRQFMDDAINFLKGLPNTLFNIGVDMIKGLINGIKSMASNVIGAIGGLVDSAIDSAKKALGINSPSKLFMQFGAWTGEGLAIGIDSESKRVAKASKGLATSVIDGYGADLGIGKINLSKSSSSRPSTTNHITINASRPLSPAEVAKETIKAQRRLAFNL